MPHQGEKALFGYAPKNSPAPLARWEQRRGNVRVRRRPRLLKTIRVRSVVPPPDDHNITKKLATLID